MTNIAIIHQREAPPIGLGHLLPSLDIELRFALLGKVLKRIGDFCEKYDTDANAESLTNAVAQDFVSDRPKEFFVYLAVRGDRVVAHLLGKLDHYYGKTFGYVHQLEIDDDARLTPEQVRKGLKAVESWAITNGAKKMRIAAVSEVHERLFRKFGFDERLLVTLGKNI